MHDTLHASTMSIENSPPPPSPTTTATSSSSSSPSSPNLHLQKTTIHKPQLHISILDNLSMPNNNLTPSLPYLPLTSPFAHASEYAAFALRVQAFKHGPEMRCLEADMADAGLDYTVHWPRGVLEWAWRHPGRYPGVQKCARGCVRDGRWHGMA
jgi:hypothetical protein